jgi:cobalamin-dependent methionine synthase I
MKILRSIPVQVPDERIYMRLGRYRHFAEISSAQKEHFAKTIAAAKSKCRSAAAWEVVPIRSNRDSEVTIEGGDVFASPGLSKLLEGCDQVLLLAVTAGTEICEAAKEASSAAETAIYDAVGSETADAAAAWIQDYVRQGLRPRGLAVAERRFSPGYGGLALSVQEIFFRRLQLAELGMTLTPAFFMIPEKSVTALAGVSRI